MVLNEFQCLFNNNTIDLCTFNSKCIINNITNEQDCNCLDYDNLIYDNFYFRSKNCVSYNFILATTISFSIIGLIYLFRIISLLVKYKNLNSKGPKKLLTYCLFINFPSVFSPLSLINNSTNIASWFILYIGLMAVNFAAELLVRTHLEVVFAVLHKDQTNLNKFLLVSKGTGVSVITLILIVGILSVLEYDIAYNVAVFIVCVCALGALVLVVPFGLFSAQLLLQQIRDNTKSDIVTDKTKLLDLKNRILISRKILLIGILPIVLGEIAIICVSFIYGHVPFQFLILVLFSIATTSVTEAAINYVPKLHAEKRSSNLSKFKFALKKKSSETKTKTSSNDNKMLIAANVKTVDSKKNVLEKEPESSQVTPE